jgi:hypothetical protein
MKPRTWVFLNHGLLPSRTYCNSTSIASDLTPTLLLKRKVAGVLYYNWESYKGHEVPRWTDRHHGDNFLRPCCSAWFQYIVVSLNSGRSTYIDSSKATFQCGCELRDTMALCATLTRHFRVSKLGNFAY